MMARLQGLSAESKETFWRSLQTLNVTRVVIVLVLLGYLLVGGYGWRSAGPLNYIEVCAAYLWLAAGFSLLAIYWRRRFMLQLLLQLALDFGVISMLYLDAGGVRSGLAILYLFPLAGAAILAPLLLALFGAALVSLFMLAESTYQILQMESDRAVLQAGLYGAAFFAVVLLVSRLAARLIGQEELAVQRGNALAVQQAINRLVIADMDDGILVAGPDGLVFTGNPAAQRMLGLAGLDASFKLSDTPALLPIAAAYAAWLDDARQHTVFLTVKPYTDSTLQGVTAAWSARRELAAHLKVRFATVDTAGLAAARSVIFLQDVTAIENQAQELKLAAMGRLTASIAHEVRNPLSAIGHATSLLAEDLLQPVQVRLLRIVGDNVGRIDRMVQDILQLSRKAHVQDHPLPLAPFLAELKTEFEETHALAAGTLRFDDVGAAAVRFDGLHLREVLLNLLNNAVRYASGTAASIRLFAVSGESRRIELHVQDDGPGISPEVRAHLFEPFYTTSSKGTGLGLYLARELCLNNGALLDYEYHFDAAQAQDGIDIDIDQRVASGRFVITFAVLS
ncbi:sensor histidine kinase [Janthinobacterium agaricidamnosum]|uniref:histidine kinase n=1 Tax=Janthinobacterium agaricidamnosum NBRC 102515 = DSM 9628 TaxID=1349767 RepID=W0UXV8_9BURK|nr:ATP-binding protein [Janthinobacterium agaricidamnosum]CDG81389.1 his Kinase A domain protein [Janthinobacterium agaricidamnosum NBRC 102515 = DSM 9628]